MSRTIDKLSFISYGGREIDFPFQKNIHQLPQSEFIECLYDLYFARSSGEVALQSHGRNVPLGWLTGPPPAAGAYAVWLHLRRVDATGRSTWVLEGSVNDARFSALLSEAPVSEAPASEAPVSEAPASEAPSRTVPPELHLCVGAHFHPEDRAQGFIEDVKLGR